MNAADTATAEKLAEFLDESVPASFVESPENHALVRAALEATLREFIFLSLPITGTPRREHFVAYLEGRFALDKDLVAKVGL